MSVSESTSANDFCAAEHLRPLGWSYATGSGTGDFRGGTATAAVDRQLREQFASAAEADVVALTSSSTAAVEWSLAAARLRDAGRRFKVISFVGGYHGDSLAARAASGLPQLQQPLGPLVAGFRHCPFADLDAVRDAIDESTTAILLQPLLTHDRGQRVSQADLSGLRAIADEHDLWLIVDETQVPVGCTGQLAVSRAFEVPADLVLLSAGLATHDGLGVVLAQRGLQLPDEAETFLRPAPVATELLQQASERVAALTDGGLERNAAWATELTESLESLRRDFEFVREVDTLGTIAILQLDVAVAEVQNTLGHDALLVGQIAPHTMALCPPGLADQDAELADQNPWPACFASLRQAFESLERPDVAVSP